MNTTDDLMLEFLCKPFEYFDSFKGPGIFRIAMCGGDICPDIYSRLGELENLIESLFEKHENLMFFVTRESDFGRAASMVLNRIRKKYNNRIIHVLVVPYISAEIKKNIYAYSSYYDIILPYEREWVPDCRELKDMMMAKESELIVAYFPEAENTELLDYARKLGKDIIELK